MIPSDTQSLINAIRTGEHLRLIDHEVTGLLSWMAGSSRSREARALHQAFGEAGKHEQATARGFLLLDRTLFKDQQLLEEIAGVAQNRSSDERRRRYRLLLSAFHPDRYPNRAEWLTERSQIITIAYSRFKSGKAPIRPLLPVVKRRPAVVRKRPRRFVRPSTKWLTRLARTLQQQFGGDPWLAQKIIGGLALVLVLPLVSVLLDTQTPPLVHSESVNTQMAAVRPEQQTTESVASSAPPMALSRTDSQSATVIPHGDESKDYSSGDPALTVGVDEQTSDSVAVAQPRVIDQASEPALLASNNSPPNGRAQRDRALAQATESELPVITEAAGLDDAVAVASTLNTRAGKTPEPLAALESGSTPSNRPQNRAPTAQAERLRQAEPSANSERIGAPSLPPRPDRAMPRVANEALDRAENNPSIAVVEPQGIRAEESLNRANARPDGRQNRSSGGSGSDERASSPSMAARSETVMAQADQRTTPLSADQAVDLTGTPSGSNEAPNTANTRVVRADRADDQPPEARGSLLLGPLGSHQIGTLLQQYQLALEQADLETLSELIGVELTAELQSLFPELFESNQQHRVDLSILQSQRDGDQWVVQLQQNVGVSAIDRRARNFSHRAEFYFRTDPFAIRIVDMDF